MLATFKIKENNIVVVSSLTLSALMMFTCFFQKPMIHVCKRSFIILLKRNLIHIYTLFFLTVSVSTTISYSQLNCSNVMLHILCVVKCADKTFSGFWGRVGLGLHMGSFWTFVFSILLHLLLLYSQMRLIENIGFSCRLSRKIILLF